MSKSSVFFSILRLPGPGTGCLIELWSFAGQSQECFRNSRAEAWARNFKLSRPRWSAQIFMPPSLACVCFGSRFWVAVISFAVRRGFPGLGTLWRGSARRGGRAARRLPEDVEVVLRWKRRQRTWLACRDSPSLSDIDFDWVANARRCDSVILHRTCRPSAGLLKNKLANKGNSQGTRLLCVGQFQGVVSS